MQSNVLGLAQKRASAHRAGVPIEHWREAIKGDFQGAFDRLRSAYRSGLPTQGELIFTGECTFKCQHCIYAPNFARHNKMLSVAEWAPLLADLASGLQISTFVYGGRAVTHEGIDVLGELRNRQPEASIGMIDNGISMMPMRERIFEVAPDWIDVSLDGLENDHDRQRGRAGSFRDGLDGAMWLVENGAAPKVNILTCLTSINRSSVIPMIRRLNGLGFHNFFVTPVTIVDSVRPAPHLRLDEDEFSAFVDELHAAIHTLDDAWVELALYAPEYARYLAKRTPAMWQAMAGERDSLVWHEHDEASASDFYIRYHPVSLTGTREIIVNTNGEVIVPNAMARGKVDADEVVGSLLAQSARDIAMKLPDFSAFEAYERELVRERDLLRRYM